MTVSVELEGVELTHRRFLHSCAGPCVQSLTTPSCLLGPTWSSSTSMPNGVGPGECAVERATIRPVGWPSSGRGRGELELTHRRRRPPWLSADKQQSHRTRIRGERHALILDTRVEP